MNEIHIKTLKYHLNHWKYLNAEHICEEQEGKEIIDALQSAIEALQKELSEDFISFPKGTLKKRGEGYVAYNVEWLKKNWPAELKVMGIECEDCTSKQAVKEQMIKYGFHAPDMTVTEFVEDLLPSVQPEQQILRCKDCNEWHKGKNHNGRDVYSDEGYCSVQRLLTGENYYCGDAESR